MKKYCNMTSLRCCGVPMCGVLISTFTDGFVYYVVCWSNRSDQVFEEKRVDTREMADSAVNDLWARHCRPLIDAHMGR